MTLTQFINGLRSSLSAEPHARAGHVTISDTRYDSLRIRRLGSGLDGRGDRQYCPITFLCHAQLRLEVGVGNWREAAEALALSSDDAQAIADAADGEERGPCFSLLRRQLTRALCIPDEAEPKALKPLTPVGR